MEKQVTLISFGFKYRRPPANNYIDVSFIRNPAREDGWSLFAKIDKDMTSFIEEQAYVPDLINNLAKLIHILSKCDDDVRLALGCSSGRHRSPIMVNILAKRLKVDGFKVITKHMEL